MDEAVALKRKRSVAVIVGLVVTLMVFNKLPRNKVTYPHVPQMEVNSVDEIIRAVVVIEQDLTAQILAVDDYAADPTRKSEACFWETYSGSAEKWYKEYRMSRDTFDQIVKDCVPHLYDRPTSG